jgi:hypothetical protein
MQTTFAVRGAIGHGDFEFNPFQIRGHGDTRFFNSSLYGKALVDIYVKAENQDWAGCFIDDTALNVLDPENQKIVHMVMMHQKFREFLINYSIPEIAIAPLKRQLAYVYESSNSRNADIKKALAGKLTEVNTKLEKLEERHAFGEINVDVYSKYTTKLLEEKESISSELEKLTIKLSNPKELFDFVCRFASKLATVWTSADYHQKQTIQNLVFPHGILYDTKIEHYRTPKVRFIFERMACLVRVSGEIKNGSFDFDLENSRLVEPAVLLVLIIDTDSQ